MKTHARPRLRRLAPLLALVLAAGCTDLGLDAGGEAVAGLTITDSGGNTLVTVSASNSVSGNLTVARNQQRAIVIVLRDESGNVVTPGLGQSIRVTTNAQVAAWTETGLGVGTLRGITSGQTRMRIDVLDSGTVEYTSPDIVVQVT